MLSLAAVHEPSKRYALPFHINPSRLCSSTTLTPHPSEDTFAPLTTLPVDMTSTCIRSQSPPTMASSATSPEASQVAMDPLSRTPSPQKQAYSSTPEPHTPQSAATSKSPRDETSQQTQCAPKPAQNQSAVDIVKFLDSASMTTMMMFLVLLFFSYRPLGFLFDCAMYITFVTLCYAVYAFLDREGARILAIAAARIVQYVGSLVSADD